MAEQIRDIIRIRGLRLSCVLGVYDFERHAPRPVDLDIELVTDTRRAATNDDLAATVDYHKLRDRIAASLEKTSFLLLERLADHVARLCLETPGVQAATIRAGKPGAVPDAQTVEVEITRTPGDLQK